MACNVVLCAVTLLTLQRKKLRYGARQKASGARRPTAVGVRMDARRAKTSALRKGLVHDSTPLKGGRTNHND